MVMPHGMVHGHGFSFWLLAFGFWLLAFGFWLWLSWLMAFVLF
jgi:hypothetical protein